MIDLGRKYHSIWIVLDKSMGERCSEKGSVDVD
jgi:hypothetical protein